MSVLTAFLAEKSARTEAAMKAYMDGWTDVPGILRESMAYSLFAGGKRLRPALALGAAEIIGKSDDVALPAACALEMIHTYSLIHDDLPSMDDDDLRRGKPTNHVVYGEAIAILAGDGLLTMAFDILAKTGNAAAVAELAQAAGVWGMVGGQVVDLESENQQLTLDALQQIHAMKTGALIRGAVRLGALLAGAPADSLAALTRYGERIGLAFQIADDILDVTGDQALIGKPVGSDEANQKSTYPALLGLDESQRLAQSAVADAIDALQPFGSEAETFRLLARYIIERNA